MDISPLSIHSISSATSSSSSEGISDSGKNTLYLNSVMIPYLENYGYEQYYLHVILEILIYTWYMNLCLFPLPLDPFLLEMTVQDLEFKLMAATDRISCLEGQVQQLTQQQWQLMHQLQTMQQQQQAYGWG